MLGIRTGPTSSRATAIGMQPLSPIRGSDFHRLRAGDGESNSTQPHNNVPNIGCVFTMLLIRIGGIIVMRTHLRSQIRTQFIQTHTRAHKKND